MRTYFELLDRATGTMLKDYATEADALQDLRAFGREHGQAQLQGLALLHVSDDRPVLVAMDAELVARVEQSEPITVRIFSVSRSTSLPYEMKPNRFKLSNLDLRSTARVFDLDTVAGIASRAYTLDFKQEHESMTPDASANGCDS
jgi:hypothetical protein